MTDYICSTCGKPGIRDILKIAQSTRTRSRPEFWYCPHCEAERVPVIKESEGDDDE